MLNPKTKSEPPTTKMPVKYTKFALALAEVSRIIPPKMRYKLNTPTENKQVRNEIKKKQNVFFLFFIRNFEDKRRFVSVRVRQHKLSHQEKKRNKMNYGCVRPLL